MGLIARRIQDLGTENAFKVVSDIRACEEEGKEVIKLNLGEPDFDSASHINETAIKNIIEGNSHYCDAQGLVEFRKKIAEEIACSRNIPADPERVVVSTGAKPFISYTMMTYVNPGDEVIYPSPGFPIYESWVTFIGAVPKPLKLHEEKNFRFTAEDLEPLLSSKTKVIIINSPSNPTGGVLRQEELREIADLIADKCSEDVRIYSDEVYEHILFDGISHSSIASQRDMEKRTILVSGHSKTYAMTGWRLGYALLPTPEEADIFKHLNINVISCTPPFIQEAGKCALESPKSQLVIKEMRDEFEKRRNYVVPRLRGIKGMTCVMPEGAFYVFPGIEGICDSLGILKEFEKLPPEIQRKTSPSTIFQMFALYEHGVATMDRPSFGRIGAEGEHFLRLSIATSLENLKEGIKRIESASKDKRGILEFIEKGKHLF